MKRAGLEGGRSRPIVKPGDILTSRGPEMVRAGKREEIDIPPEPRDHAQPS